MTAPNVKHTMEQLGAFWLDWADVIGGFYLSLVGKGISPEHALTMTLLNMRIAHRPQPPKTEDKP